MSELIICPGTCTFRSRPAEMKCACGTGHKMLPFANFFVHHEGEHWVLECLTQKLLDQNELLNKEAQEARQSVVTLYRKVKDLREKIAGLRCASCNNLLGKTGRIVGDELICKKCSEGNDLGGEG